MRRAAAAVAAGIAVAALVFVSCAATPPATPFPGLVPGLGGLSAAGGPGCTPGAALGAPGRAQASRGALSGPEVARLAHAAGWRGEDLVIAVAVAKAESGWNPRADNVNTDGSTDFGLWQVNTVHGALLRTGDPLDPADNARMAFRVWTDAGGSWRPWVTFWRGTYRQHLSEAQAAVGGVADAVAARPGCSTAVVAAAGLSDPGPGPGGSDGLVPRAANVRAITMARWGCSKHPAPCIRSTGGYAPRTIAGTGTPSDHSLGRAVDIMLGSDFRDPQVNALGREIAEFFVVNSAALGVYQVIYDNKIWNAKRNDPVGPWDAWRTYCHPMGCGAGATLQHEDHPHVGVRG